MQLNWLWHRPGSPSSLLFSAYVYNHSLAFVWKIQALNLQICILSTNCFIYRIILKYILKLGDIISISSKGFTKVFQITPTKSACTLNIYVSKKQQAYWTLELLSFKFPVHYRVNHNRAMNQVWWLRFTRREALKTWGGVFIEEMIFFMQT